MRGMTRTAWLGTPTACSGMEQLSTGAFARHSKSVAFQGNVQTGQSSPAARQAAVDTGDRLHLRSATCSYAQPA